MANQVVKDIEGNIILTDGTTIKERIEHAELDETAVENETPIQLVVLDDDAGANFCTECGSRNIYCIREADNAYQIVCRDCGHRLGFRTRQFLNSPKNTATTDTEKENE